MKCLTGFLFTAIVIATIFGSQPAKADTYHAGEFTITFNEHPEYGRTYRGCDAKGNCINLDDGTAWRDNGYRGITWDNGEYSYSVSWREETNEAMYLSIFRNKKRILRHKLVVVEKTVVTPK